MKDNQEHKVPSKQTRKYFKVFHETEITMAFAIQIALDIHITYSKGHRGHEAFSIHPSVSSSI
jgi:hypothetical protein